MYRCVALAALEAGVDLDDAEAMGDLAERARDRARRRPGLARRRATSAPRSASRETTAAASRVSVHPRVREAMVARQRAPDRGRPLRRRGPRHRHRRQPRLAAEGLPHRLRRGARPPPRRADRRGRGRGPRGPARARRARREPRAQRPAGRRGRGRDRHHRPRARPRSSTGSSPSPASGAWHERFRPSPSSASPTSARAPWSTAWPAAARRSPTAEPGVTRDRKRVRCEWNGVAFELLDTGGIDLDDEAELARDIQPPGPARDRRGRRRPAGRRRAAPGCAPATPSWPGRCAAATCPVLVVVNKVDRPEDEHLTAEFHSLGLGEPLAGLRQPRPRHRRPARPRRRAARRAPAQPTRTTTPSGSR